jgi:hypothetical protein
MTLLDYLHASTSQTALVAEPSVENALIPAGDVKEEVAASAPEDIAATSVIEPLKDDVSGTSPLRATY